MRVRDVLAGKMVLLNKLLDKLHKGGHRVLIFSQVRRLLSATARSCMSTAWSDSAARGSSSWSTSQAKTF